MCHPAGVLSLNGIMINSTTVWTGVAINKLKNPSVKFCAESEKICGKK